MSSDSDNDSMEFSDEETSGDIDDNNGWSDPKCL